MSAHPARAPLGNVEVLGQKRVVLRLISVMCMGVSLSSQMFVQDTVTRLWQTGAVLTSCRSLSPRCSAAVTSAGAGLRGSLLPPKCVPSEQRVRALPFIHRVSLLNPLRAQGQCTCCRFSGNRGKWITFQKIKEMAFREISPGNEQGKYRGPYKWHCSQVLYLT